MDLPRIARKWVRVTTTATLDDGSDATLTGMEFALLPYKVEPDADTTWTAAGSFGAGEPDEDGTPTWVARVMVVGPEADPTDALPAPVGISDLWARVTDVQEVDAEMVLRIRVR